MSWRTVLIQNRCSLSLKNAQLRCERNDGVVTIPVEDITVLILETAQATVTTSLLAALQDHNVAVITCDGRHMPNGLLLPFLPHSRLSEIAALQRDWSRPFRKRCWQRIVQAKIGNQADCLMLTGQDTGTALRQMARRVDSGDTKNREAQAARDYWKRLMPPGFVRGAADFANAVLNYGYMVVRAAVARSLVSYGLLPCFGLHHDSNLNAYNLADDLLEPFRPFVDREVIRLVGDMPPAGRELSRQDRQTLAALPTRQVLIDGEVQTLTNAADRVASSLVRALREKDSRLLHLPLFAV
ncbi:type II CRISPR-associated endonuclease Cas1 [Luteithermobacter gelatinilyticus]|uniref:type II CRISPR-associated endonuclease Cas1 n=1 Tax=Luteithermobacter gelatinilyticus TaxID=2582913 RepID=UPI001AEFFB0B|nr:type II CRISPR-associated endonuclease Cas1 [Luteithermobacter gelatinilyticus]